MIGVFHARFLTERRSGSNKASIFSAAYKAFILRQGDDGVPEGGDQPGDVFQLAEEVCGSAVRRYAPIKGRVSSENLHS